MSIIFVVSYVRLATRLAPVASWDFTKMKVVVVRVAKSKEKADNVDNG